MPGPASLKAGAPARARSHDLCLKLTIAECAVAFTIALTQWVNLMPLWLAAPEARQWSQLAGYMTTGYGFWGAAWALPCWVMLHCADAASVRRFAQLSAVMLVLWWVFWWGQMWDGTWHTWVLVLYLPLRAFQLWAHARRGFGPEAAPPPEPAEPATAA